MGSETSGGGTSATRKRHRVTAFYPDGTALETYLRPVAIVAAERRYGKDSPPAEATMFAAWYLLRREHPDRVADDFDRWLDELADIEEELVDPTKATEHEPSPDSP